MADERKRHRFLVPNHLRPALGKLLLVEMEGAEIVDVLQLPLVAQRMLEIQGIYAVKLDTQGTALLAAKINQYWDARRDAALDRVFRPDDRKAKDTVISPHRVPS
jgi:hypothetical protein